MAAPQLALPPSLLLLPQVRSRPPLGGPFAYKCLEQRPVLGRHYAPASLL